jgi:peptidoglycan/xylan/chitin deacetylase (PgdA/CDA1 family)
MKQALKQVVRATGLRREHVAAGRLCCERHFLATFGRARKRWVGRILCYHSIGQEEFGVNDVSEANFRRHIEMALNAGHRFVPASEIACTGGGSKDIAITFDDGLKSVRTLAAPILKDYAIPWTFFPVSEWSDKKHAWCEDLVLDWRDMEALMKDGAELGSHSATHPDFTKIDQQRVVDELGESRDTIEKRLGFAPKTFAIPFGQSGNWPVACAQAARDAGYETIYAQAEETRPEGTVARTFVTKYDGDRIFKALLAGKYDRWEEWV